MMHELSVFLQRMVGLISCLVLGILLGGIWMLIGTVMRRDAPPALVGSFPAPQAVERALDAEVAFATGWPGQRAAVAWWGWSAVATETRSEDLPPPKANDVAAAMTMGITKPIEKVSAAINPWLRLVWIRGAAVLGLIVAATVPALAWWLEGRRRAYVRYLMVATPSDGNRRAWVVIVSMCAVVTGVFVGAPIVAPMAPWIFLGVLVTVTLLYPLRANMVAQLP